ncbi:unnamed protein product [Cochlearia groenlandica]
MSSPDRTVRNVLADLDVVAKDDSGSGVKSHLKDEGEKEPEEGSVKGTESEEADHNPFGHNVAENSNLGVDHIPQCAKDEYISTLSNQVYDEWDNQVIMLGWSEQVEVPPGDENILPTVS